MLGATCARLACVAESRPTVIEPLVVTGPPAEVIPVPAVLEFLIILNTSSFFNEI